MIKLDIEDLPAKKTTEAKRQEPAGDFRSSYASYISLTYWQQYFDITQSEILERLTTTVNPQKMALFETIKAKPDLYVPFWVASCLVFCLFAFGNLSGAAVLEHYNYDYIGSAVSLLYG